MSSPDGDDGSPPAEVPEEQQPTDANRPNGVVEKAWEKVVRHPNVAYGAACGSYCFVFLLFVLLIFVLGEDFFPFSNDVPLYLRDHVTRERMDALSEGKDEADYTLDAATEDLRQSVDTLGGDYEDLTLEIIYLPKYGDMLESALVAAVHDFEMKVLARNKYGEYCLKEYSKEQVAAEAADDVTEVRRVNELDRPCAVHETIFWSCDVANGWSCAALESTPVGIMSCPIVNTSCEAKDFVVNDVFKSMKADVYAKSVPDIRTVEGLNSWNFLKLVDSQFGSGNQIVRAARSVFTFGVPFKGSKTSTDDQKKQSDDLAEWLYDSYNDWLASGQLENPDVTVIFNGHGMLGLYIASKLVSDGMFMMASMVFVMFYIAFMTSSWWLSLMGMGQIVMSTGPAYFLYFAVFQQRYFGVFNMLCIFIILGIGADDIFVFLDTWSQSAGVYPAEVHWKRMSWTWKHAGKAMLVTSLSTIISFVANANSSFPAIQTFGIYAALLVLVNYCAVMIYFPTAVLMYAKHFENVSFCCGAASWVAGLLDGISTKQSSAKIFPEYDNPTDIEKQRLADETDKALNPVPYWFRTAYADGIIQARYVILAMFTALGVGMIMAGTRIEPDPEVPKFFPSDDNYQRFADTKPVHFVRGGSVNAILITFAWGFDASNPIDRDGTRATDMDNFGKPVWNPDFNLPKAARCIVSICNTAEAKNDIRKTGGYPDFPIECPMADFKRHVDANDSAIWDKITGVNAQEGLFYDHLITWMSDPAVLSQWKPFIFGELHPETGPIMRFITAELKLTITNSIEASDGISLWQAWEDWFGEQYTKSPCVDVYDAARGFQASMEFAFVRDKLVSEAFAGIYLSVALSFCVLTVATTNIIIAAYAVFVIIFIVSSTLGTIVILGWKLGILESIGLVMVPGLSVDFVAHLAEAYVESSCTDREGRLRDMLGRVGISIISGAISTLGASAFLFFPTIIFFNKFGIMMFITIGFSLFWALLLFPAMLTTPLGPQGNVGNWLYLVKKLLKKKEEGREGRV